MPKRLSAKLFDRDFSIRWNILSSFAGNGLAVVLFFLSVPAFLSYLGVEAYGLVGFFVSFQAALSVLDLGLAVTLTRELAVRAADPQRTAEIRDLVRTVEAVQWAVALIVGGAIFFLSPLLAGYANPDGLSSSVLAECFAIMSVALAFQFPIGLYSGGLFGLQRQVLFNTVNVFFAVFRNLGAIAALHFVSSTPQMFFVWQAVSSALHAAVLAVCVWRSMPGGAGTPAVRIALLKDIWRFASGLGAISILSVLITQIDKLLLIRLLPLEIFGYYAIAGVVSGGVHRLIQPIFQAYLPRLSQIAGMPDKEQLVRTYHQGCQLIAVAVLPFCIVCIFFSWEILLLWQRDQTIADNSYFLLSLLAAGGALNALLFVPYALQLAHGWTKLNLVSLTLAVCLSVPAIIVLTAYFGAAGAAAVWIIFNAVFILVLIPIMHSRLVQTEKWKWYLNDLLIPLAAVTAVAMACRYLFVSGTGYVLLFLQLATVFTVAQAAAIISAGHIRDHIRKWIM